MKSTYFYMDRKKQQAVKYGKRGQALFFSYGKFIAFRFADIASVAKHWNTSRTTAKYTAQFFGLDNPAEVREAIRSGEIILETTTPGEIAAKHTATE